MRSFMMNGYIWLVQEVSPYDPNLIDRNGVLTLGVTDPDEGRVYLSSGLSDDMLVKVLLHEIGHCAIFSFGLLDDIHRLAKKEHWAEAEEWVCNFIADYGLDIFRSASEALGDEVWDHISKKLEVML